jgi:hypothetical protein
LFDAKKINAMADLFGLIPALYREVFLNIFSSLIIKHAFLGKCQKHPSLNNAYQNAIGTNTILAFFPRDSFD